MILPHLAAKCWTLYFIDRIAVRRWDWYRRRLVNLPGLCRGGEYYFLIFHVAQFNTPPNLANSLQSILINSLSSLNP